MCGQMRSDTVSLTEHSALTSVYIHNQVCYSNVCAVRDKSGHPDHKAAGHRMFSDLRFVLCPS